MRLFANCGMRSRHSSIPALKFCGRELKQLTGDGVAHGGENNGAVNGSKARRKTIVPKYRGPDGRTWTGRGMKPRWLTSELNNGKTLEDFIIVAPEEEVSGPHLASGRFESKLS